MPIKNTIKHALNAFWILFSILFVGCQQSDSIKHTLATDDIKHKKAFLTKIDYPIGSPSAHAFLPYLANHGICQSAPKIEVLTIAKQLKKEDVVAVYPLGTLILKEKNTERPIIIATPIDTTLQITSISNYQQFLIEQSGMHQIIQDWFLYEKGLGEVNLVGWRNEQYAWQLVNM